MSTDTDKLEFDESAFLTALQEDPASVEKLLTGENGILGQMEKSVEQMLSASTGFFDVKTTSIDSDISRKQEKIF